MKKMKEEESITYILIRYDLPTKIRNNGTTQARKRTKMKKIYKSLSLNRNKLTKFTFSKINFRWKSFKRKNTKEIEMKKNRERGLL